MTESSSNQPRSAVLLTVGGSPAPVIYSLNKQQPQFICFFVTEESKGLISSAILPALTFHPQHHDWIVTPDGESLSACYRALRDNLQSILEKWGVGWGHLSVDYTGGTKVMSGAVLLATVKRVSRYAYIGSADPKGRAKSGVGVVLDGRERIFTETNPWKDMAEDELPSLALLFNHGQYGVAANLAEQLRDLVPTKMSAIYSAATEAIRGYREWDRFNYKTARNRLGQGRRDLVPYSIDKNDVLAQLARKLDEHIDFLTRLQSPPATDGDAVDPNRTKMTEPHRLDILDVLANAMRRGEIEHRYDDAVARLYAGIEAIARYQLLDVYGIDSSGVQPSQIPEELREEYVQRYSSDDTNDLLRFGLWPSYSLLASLGDEVGMRFDQSKQEFESLLAARNTSRLAHGSTPVKSSVYESLCKLALQFADVERENLPQFPHLSTE